MKPFKFFQKERKPMFSGILERLRTGINIPTHHNFATDDDLRLINNLDYEVIALVHRYFDNGGDYQMETDTMLLTISQISDNLGRDINVTVNVSSRINPFLKMEYSLVKTGVNVLIMEKRATLNETV